MSERTSSSPLPRGCARASDLDEAAAWVARRDRGLSADEQAVFARWRRDPENLRRLGEIAGPFAALDRAAQLRPADGSPPDADFLRAPRRQRFGHGIWLAGGLAAAAMIGALLFSLADNRREETSRPAHGGVVRHEPGRTVLPDGSTIEFRPGTRVATEFTAQERRVRLTFGDAHFTVAKDAARPFIVTIGSVKVRAVGTAFTISASNANVEVLVTEGRVRVDDVSGRTLIAPEPAAAAGPFVVPAAPASPVLDAGQRVLIPVQPGRAEPVPATAATAEIVERAAAWRSVWLEFGDMPLASVAAEFNRHAAELRQPRLLTADEPTGRVLVSGTFRADSVEAFVRLLRSGFAIEATSQRDGTVVLHAAD